MPHIRTAQQLRLYAGSVGFLNRTNNQPQSGTGPSEYQIVNDFTMKLMDLQDKLRAELGGAELGNQAGRFARGLMDLQMHDSSVITQASLGNAVTTVTLDLPNFLKQKGRDEAEKTGYQRLVEAGEKYGSFTKEELDPGILYDPDTNIRYGTYMLSFLYTHYNRWEAVYSAFKVGKNTVEVWLDTPSLCDENGNLKKIPDEETEKFVRDVKKDAEKYRDLYYK